MDDESTLELPQPQINDTAASTLTTSNPEDTASSITQEETIPLATTSPPPLKTEEETVPLVATSPSPPKADESTPGGPSTPTPKPPRRWMRILLIILLILLIILGGTAAYGYYYFDNNIQKPLNKLIHPVSRSTDEPTLNHKTVNQAPDDGAITGRSWNILLLGSDNDNKYTFPVILTQVMMVVHIDTVHHSVYMVSIPRDSWVYVPGDGGMHKIDQAFFIGASQHNSFDNGVRAARLTIEKDYGITIDRYAWVGLSGFAKVIDTLGGVDVDVIHPIIDDIYPDDTGVQTNDLYAVKRLYIAAGPQHMNGLQALEYVRSRHADLIGDFGRTERQQQVLTALRQKLNAVNVVTHLSDLIKDLVGNVYTDLSEQEMLAFANFGRTLTSDDIQHLTLGPGVGNQDYGDDGTIYDPWAGSEQSIVVPHCENIQPVINRIFALGNVQSCKVNG